MRGAGRWVCFGVATCGKAPGRHLHADAAAAQMLWAQEGAALGGKLVAARVKKTFNNKTSALPPDTVPD